MKAITAIVRSHMLDHVLHELEHCEHFPGVTISACQGESRGRGTGGAYRAEPSLSLSATARLELYCSDEHFRQLVDTISNAARTGNPGDGVIGVTDLFEVVRIRSGERNDAAV